MRGGTVSTQKNLGLGRRADALATDALLAHTLKIAGDACELEGADLVLVTPRGESVSHTVDHRIEQRGRNFEERFSSALEDTFELGYARVVVIGGDAPELDANHLVNALSTADTVLGPSQDGGFYLLGIQRSSFRRELLHGLTWNTNRVFREITSRLSDSRLRFLETLNDLDDSRDAQRALSYLSGLVFALTGLRLSNRTEELPPLIPSPKPVTSFARTRLSRGPPRLVAAV